MKPETLFVEIPKRMTIHNLYMFDRHGVLMYYGEWNRKRQSGMTIEEVI